MSRKKVQHVGKILFSILSVLLGFLGILLFTSSRWMLATWAHLDMEELVYHLKAPLEGTSKDVLWSYVWSCGMISFAVLAILIALFIILRHRKKWKSFSVASALPWESLFLPILFIMSGRRWISILTCTFRTATAL